MTPRSKRPTIDLGQQITSRPTDGLLVFKRTVLKEFNRKEG
jgi:hypothetical protein